VKKFSMDVLKPVSTPISMGTLLDPDENSEAIDQKEYKSMIDSLMYLTATWPDIQFTACLYARFQASSCSSHQMIVQRISRYLKHTSEFEI
jgi:hypothetical protein